MKTIAYIKEKVIDQIEISELDLKTPEEIIGDLDNFNNDEWFKIIEDDDFDFYGWRDGEYVKIDLLLENLNKLKKQGSNYVKIYHHDDHHSYILTGVDLKEMSPDEVNEQKKKELGAKLDMMKNNTKIREQMIKQDQEDIKKLL